MTDTIACPWCGKHPKREKFGGRWYLECTHVDLDDDTCVMLVCSAETLGAAIKAWNSRVGVHCSQCKHFHSQGDDFADGDVYECDWCDMVGDVAYPDGFCAWGERRDA